MNSDNEFFLNSFENNASKNMVSFYHCKDCDTSFYCNDLNGNSCIFCNGNNIEKLEEEKDNSIPIIPFVKSMDDAVDCYKRNIFWNPFIPLYFKRKKNYQNFKKVYVPCYLLDANVAGNIYYRAMDKHTNGEAYDVALQTNFDYNQLVLKKCSLFSDSLFESIGIIDLKNLVDCDASLLRETYIIKDNLSYLDVSSKLRDQIMDKSIKMSEDGVLHSQKVVKKNDLEIFFHNMKEVLVPIYYLKIIYHGKNNYYLMNGENGKCNYEIMNSKLGIVLFSIIVFLLLLLISYFVFFL